MKKVILIVCLLMIGLSSEAQKKNKNAKLSIEVDGVCMMCKKRIEKAALNTKGVKFAVWSIKTHLLSLIIDERKTDKKTIQKNIAAVGHDTKGIKAKDHVYNEIDPCCKYRDQKVVDDHKKEGGR
ncbi:MAG: cation transporter [Flavobacteriaceae bacterium]